MNALAASPQTATRPIVARSCKRITSRPSCLPVPAGARAAIDIELWGQCGGKGGNCGSFGACKDSAYPAASAKCSVPGVCARQSEWCVPVARLPELDDSEDGHSSPGLFGAQRPPVPISRATMPCRLLLCRGAQVLAVQALIQPLPGTRRLQGELACFRRGAACMLPRTCEPWAHACACCLQGLSMWDQCGGKSSTHVKDSANPGLCCPGGSTCERVNEW